MSQLCFLCIIVYFCLVMTAQEFTKAKRMSKKCPRAHLSHQKADVEQMSTKLSEAIPVKSKVSNKCPAELAPKIKCQKMSTKCRGLQKNVKQMSGRLRPQNKMSKKCPNGASGQPTDRPASRPASRSAGRSAGWSAGWSVGRLSGGTVWIFV